MLCVLGRIDRKETVRKNVLLRSACRCAASWLRCAAGAAGDARGLVGRGELVALRAGDARGLVAVACTDTGAANWLQLRGAGGAMLFSYAIEGF